MRRVSGIGYQVSGIGKMPGCHDLIPDTRCFLLSFVKTAPMKVELQTKLRAMLWDSPEERRLETTNNILSNPVDTFINDDQLFLKALNSLKWYELINPLGK
ncbi:MAG: hypothetical protein NTV01_12720 [Bacteroidia bacterium]|nr:hypothetical protein [Bacteroidia bacterium]